jgi:hypothetical protein
LLQRFPVTDMTHPPAWPLAILDDRLLVDGHDHLRFRGAAIRAVLHVDVEDALARPRPADAVHPSSD